MQESFKGLLKLLGGVPQNSRGAWPKVLNSQVAREQQHTGGLMTPHHHATEPVGLYLADELRLDHKG